MFDTLIDDRSFEERSKIDVEIFNTNLGSAELVWNRVRWEVQKSGAYFCEWSPGRSW